MSPRPEAATATGTATRPGGPASELVLQAARVSSSARDALRAAVRVTLGQRFRTSADLWAHVADGSVTVVNLAGQVTSPSQLVLLPHSAGRIALEAWQPGRPVRMDLSSADVVRLDTPRLTLPVSPVAAAALEPHLAGSWFASEDGRRFGLPALERAVAGEPEALLGLGPGLTPAGDDALVALVAWHTALGTPLPGRERLSALARARRLQEYTTATSATLLRCALAGQTSADLNHLLLAAHDDPVRIGAAAARVAGHGHSSGADALTMLHLLWSTEAATAHPIPALSPAGTTNGEPA